MPKRTRTPGFIDRASNRGISLIEILIAVSILTIIFLFVAQALVASSRTLSLDAGKATQIAAANYYLGLMKSDAEFWTDESFGFGTGGAVDVCGNQLTPYNDVYPSPPAVPNWHPAPACNLSVSRTSSV